jgi:hypothetical protein
VKGRAVSSIDLRQTECFAHLEKWRARSMNPEQNVKGRKYLGLTIRVFFLGDPETY